MSLMSSFFKHQHGQAVQHLIHVRAATSRRLRAGDDDPQHRIAKAFTAADTLLQIEEELGDDVLLAPPDLPRA